MDSDDNANPNGKNVYHFYTIQHLIFNSLRNFGNNVTLHVTRHLVYDIYIESEQKIIMPLRQKVRSKYRKLNNAVFDFLFLYSLGLLFCNKISLS